MLENDPYTEPYWLIVIIAVIILLILLVRLVLFFFEFSIEMKYLNCEIGRTEGAERRHWIRQKRRLWLSLIPFLKYR